MSSSTRRGRSASAAASPSASSSPSPTRRSPTATRSSPRKSIPTTPTTSGAKGRGRGRAVGEQKSSAAALDESFEFGSDAEAEAEENAVAMSDGEGKGEGEREERKGGGKSGRAKRQPATPSPKKGRAGAGRRGVAASEEKGVEEAASEEEEESSESKEMEDAGRRRVRSLGGATSTSADLDAEYSTPFNRPSLLSPSRVGSSVGGASSQLRKADREKLMDPKGMREAMEGGKEEIIKRLKKLSLVLSTEAQHPTGPTSKHRQLASLLIDRALARNRSQEVRALAACCVTDLFRIFAPDAPYKDEQLKGVFDLLLQQLGHLSEPQSPDFTRYFFLLETMVNIELVAVLCNKDENCDAILMEMFELFFALAQHELNAPVFGNLLTIMGSVLNTCDPIPDGLIDFILRQLTPEVLEQNAGAANLAIQTLNRYQERVERQVKDLLIDMLLRQHEDEEDLKTTITDRSDQLSVLTQLHIYCPTLMQSFQPQTIRLVETADDDEREEMTNIFCQVFQAKAVAEQPAVAAGYADLFDVLMRRLLDKDPRIRHRVATAAGDLLIAQIHNQENRQRIIDDLMETMKDREESVRLAAMESICKAALQYPELLKPEQIELIANRCMDKKASVRQTALRCLADLFARHCSPYWRQGQQIPPVCTTYRSIARKLVLAASLDVQMGASVDLLLDEKLLGSDVSVEERTRTLIGIYTSLLDRNHDAQRVVPLVEAEEGWMVDEDELQLSNAASVASAAAQLQRVETFPSQARKVFQQQVLGRKLQIRKLIHDMLQLHAHILATSRSSTGTAANLSDEMERRKHSLLTMTAKFLVYDSNDLSGEECVAALQAIVFEAKDKNIHKHLKTLIQPLTQYEHMRTAHRAVIAAVKAMTTTKEKIKKSTLLTTITRLSQLSCMTLFPAESIDMLYRELETNLNIKRLMLVKAAQELLLLMAREMPQLLTHPHTIEALEKHLTHGKDETIITNALHVTARAREAAKQQKNQKLMSRLLSYLKSLALGSHALHARLAVECIYNLWGPDPASQRPGVAAAEKEEVEEKKEKESEKETEAELMLEEILSEHASTNLEIDSPSLVAALCSATRIIQLDYHLFASSPHRRTFLNFLIHKLLPTPSIVALSTARLAAIQLIQAFLLGFGTSVGQSGSALIDIQTESQGKDASITPQQLLIMMLKILKLDGRTPKPNTFTRQQLEEEAGLEETVEEREARLQLLLATSFGILELCTLPYYCRFFLHPPQHHVPPRKEEEAAPGALTPKMGSVPHRHPYHFTSLAFVARHTNREIARRFIDRVAEMLTPMRKLPIGFFVILTFADVHPDHAFTQHIKDQMIVAIRRQRALAHLYQARHAQAAEEAESKKRKKKTKSQEEKDSEEAAAAEDRRRQAHSAMPEYLLADLIYLLSYDPTFRVEGVAAAKEEVELLFESYNSMAAIFEFLVEALLHDGPEHHGGNVGLMLQILNEIRKYEDVRDATNTKIYKLMELATLVVQRHSNIQKWNPVTYSKVQLSSLHWKPRSNPLPAKPFLPASYTLPQHIQKAVHPHRTAAAAAAAAAEEADQEARTPRKKRRAKRTAGESGSSRKRKTAPSSGDEQEGDESDVEDRRTPRKTPRARKEGAAKPEPTPTRQRLTRDAKKAAVKYTEESSDVDMEEEEEEEEEEEDYVIVSSPTKRARVSRSPAKSRRRASLASEEEEEEGSDAVDVEMDGFSSPTSSRSQSRYVNSVGSSKLKSKSNGKMHASEAKSPVSRRQSKMSQFFSLS